ncbi:Molybdenum cofactor sulfurase [Rhynchospora pubera]|uniref:Molybdenum cofactor sulfurase n=1 Tax=Rhynchospora pubera TaxID=906938 RepID=A0AAV8GLM7_9POAL|nr:Molybdenum cofactor sulfurase [Rhynchospora pubera]
MHLSLWKPLSHCASLLLDKKPDYEPHSRRPSIIRRVQEAQLCEALEEASEDGCLSKSQAMDPDPDQDPAMGPTISRSRSLARLQAQKDFLQSTALLADRVFLTPGSIPGMEEAFEKFLTVYPKYHSSDQIDKLRSEEYSHLSDDGAKVCLDYCGFGLFSYTQSFQNFESTSFTLREITTANLNNHALYGGPEVGTVEHDIKARIMDYLNMPESEYGLVFTVSRGAAFKLLAECYPFQTNKKMLTMFDHESQSVNWMAQSAKDKGAKVCSANFKWPTLRLCSAELRKSIARKKRKKDHKTGLFVFPVQSRVTGAKYSYQWMALAQQNNWHVLLDAGALGPKDMDSLGLSLFRPDFIITSFYRVFGMDPTGFGCLLIKKSVMGCLQSLNGCSGSGMVRLVPVFPQYLSDSIDGLDAFVDLEEEAPKANGNGSGLISDQKCGSQMPAFSGAYTSSQVREVFESEMSAARDSSSDKDGASTIFEENESISMGEVMRSPVFSEDGSSENSFWVDLGSSPNGSEPDHSGQLRKSKLGSPFSPSWLTKKKNGKVSKSPLYDGHVVSFDDAVLSVSQDLDRVDENRTNGTTGTNFEQLSEIQEEEEFQTQTKSSLVKESAIRRETEGEFRLLGQREMGPAPRVSFNLEEEAFFSGSMTDCRDDLLSEDFDGPDESGRREPEIVCRHIDHIDLMGLNRTTLRLRYLINWLVTSLLQLRIDGDVPVVCIYGPKIKYERGAALAFNVKDCSSGSNGSFVKPETVLRLAEKCGIFLGIGFLNHMKVGDNTSNSKIQTMRIEVVTASLGFLTNFEDVYRMWAFIAKFLQPSFLESEMGLSAIAEG